VVMTIIKMFIVAVAVSLFGGVTHVGSKKGLGIKGLGIRA